MDRERGNIRPEKIVSVAIFSISHKSRAYSEVAGTALFVLHPSPSKSGYVQAAVMHTSRLVSDWCRLRCHGFFISGIWHLKLLKGARA